MSQSTAFRRTTRAGLALATAGAAALVAGAGLGSASQSPKVVSMRDDCDPVTFTGAGVPCVGDGETTFQALIGQLMATGSADRWRFNNPKLDVNAGRAVVGRNDGGEAHTFTRVARFGGSCIPEINAVLGTSPVPECATSFLATLAGPGQSVTATGLSKGTHTFQCLIHPWMRSVVTVD